MNSKQRRKEKREFNRKYPYNIVDGPFKSYDAIIERKDWLIENSTGPWHFDHLMVWHFAHEKDAVAYRMVF